MNHKRTNTKGKNAPDDVKVLSENDHIGLTECGTELIRGAERELEGSHVDTRQVDGTRREPGTGVLGERITVDVLSWSAGEVQLGMDDTEEKRTTGLLTLRTVELDGGGADRVISEVVRALVVEVIKSSLMSLLLNGPEQTRHGVVEHDTGIDLGRTRSLGMEVRDLDVADEVLMAG